MVDTICDNCRNKDICKWTDEMERIELGLKDIGITIDSSMPMKIAVICSKYTISTSAMMRTTTAML